MVKFFISFLFLCIFNSTLVGLNDSNLKHSLRKVKVIRVYDGDSIYVQDEFSFYPVRLAYIDAPEKGQPFSEKARGYLVQLLKNRLVFLDIIAKDKYDRVLAEVFYNNLNINKEMVQNGYAWCYRQFGHSDYLELETASKLKRLGVWSLSSPEPPWHFRKRNFK